MKYLSPIKIAASYLLTAVKPTLATDGVLCNSITNLYINLIDANMLTTHNIYIWFYIDGSWYCNSSQSLLNGVNSGISGLDGAVYPKLWTRGVGKSDRGIINIKVPPNAARFYIEDASYVASPLDSVNAIIWGAKLTQPDLLP
jgi:hypothetical protein